MRTKIVTVASSIIIAVGLVGCGSSGSGQAAPTLVTATGNGVLGPVADAQVEATDLNETQTYGSAITAADGSYTLNMQIKPTGAFVIMMSGGSYTDESTGQTTIQSQALHAVVPSLSGSTVSVAVTPLTEIAYQLYKAGYHNANTQVAQMFFGTSGLVTDVTQVIPTNPSQTLQDDASGQYEYVLAQVSKAASTASQESSQWANSEGASVVSTASSGSSASVSLPSSPSGVTTASGFTVPTGTSVAFTNTNTYTTPSIITNSATFWLKADSLTSNSNGASLNAWNDSSSSGYTCTLHNLSTGDVAPTYVASSQGGMPAVSFGGSTDKNEEFDCNNGTSTFNLSSSSLTVMFVANGAQSVVSNNPEGGLVTNGAFNTEMNNISGTPGVGGSIAGSSASYRQTLDPSWSGTQVGSLEYAVSSGTASMSLWQNGYGVSGGLTPVDLATIFTYGSASSGSIGTVSAPSSGLEIGGGFAGDIQEIVIFPTALSNSDRSTVECYFSTKYALNLSSCQ